MDGCVCGPIIAPESIDPEKKQRSCAANTYLALVQGRPNLTVYTETTVTRILLDKSQPQAVVAKGVSVNTKDGESKTITARKEVILAAGTINSPRLLELSGIGGADLLQSLGIEVIVDNPHVGENLQNHPYTGVAFEVRDDVETLDALLRGDPDAISAAMQDYATKGTGPLSTSSIITCAQLPLPGNRTDDEAGHKDRDELLLHDLDAEADAARSPPTTPAFATAHEAFVRSVLVFPTEPSATYTMGPGYAPFEAPSPTYRAPGKRISVVVTLSHPLSRGSVHITSAKPEHAGGNQGLTIDPRYLSHPLDVEVLARHIRFTEQAIGRAEPLARYLKPRTDRFTDLEETKAYVHRTVQGAHHLTGTCAMMPRAMRGVVDDKLRVHGCVNLRVCDSSIIPMEPTANTQAVVYGVAENGASIIKQSI